MSSYLTLAIIFIVLLYYAVQLNGVNKQLKISGWVGRSVTSKEKKSLGLEYVNYLLRFIRGRYEAEFFVCKIIIDKTDNTY